ncbi:MAG: Gfo/Idh/MocA family oxidoreductase [Desulfosarcinaceae bacterium]|nr:Gfo/Idh/MocA family oxidoreductase [Desulfosarcinaceae bacterium]
MMPQPTLSLLVVDESSAVDPLAAYLAAVPHVRLETVPRLPETLNGYDVVISRVTLADDAQVQTLTAFVHGGGGWLALVRADDGPLPDLLGATASPPGQAAELRVLFERFDHPLAARLPDAVYLPGRHHYLTPTHADTESLLYADWHYEHISVMTQRQVGLGRAACTTLAAYAHPFVQRLCYRLCAHLAGRPMASPSLGVGILGYAPSVGRLHGLGIEDTAGFDLRSVCDLNPRRSDQAKRDFPQVQIHPDAKALAEAPDIDLVIVATPPNTHAELSLALMAAGKHVVCEKPLALNQRECDALAATAEHHQVHLSCHQNRRWDADYLTIRDSLAQGLVGDLFYLETFVGGFHHPCGYWHSHAPVCGGTSYDWGAHYIDWIVSLIPDTPRSVVGTRHKRVWHDVTNADQEKIQIRFAGGVEAEFLHSDIAAARKPKWYLLGTQGAITGQWRDVRTRIIDPDHYYRDHDIPATEMTPEITVHHRRAEGEITRITPTEAPRQPFCFHRNLADHLLLGEPITAPLADSVRVVAILEAAARSMEKGGRVEVLDGI